jgi:hypothetical protein
MTVKLWKQRNRRDAIVLSLLSAVITCYFIPVVGDTMPTAESLNTYIFKPISDYVQEVLNIKSEVQKT